MWGQMWVRGCANDAASREREISTLEAAEEGPPVSEAEVTVPLLGKGLAATEIAADAEFGALIRRSLQRIAEECVEADVALEKARG